MSGLAGSSILKSVGLGRLGELLGISTRGLSFWEIMAVSAFTIGTLTIMSYSAPFDTGWWERSGLLFSIAVGAWMGGGAIGFLFGVPRYKSSADASGLGNLSSSAQNALAFTPNTNLEQISDWLTKIIVGATLVQLGAIRDIFVQICVQAEAHMHREASGFFCGGMLIFFFFSGFLWGYLWCSIRIFREMVNLTAKIQDQS